LVGAALPDVAGTGEARRVVFDDRRARGAGVPCDRDNIEDLSVLTVCFKTLSKRLVGSDRRVEGIDASGTESCFGAGWCSCLTHASMKILPNLC